MDPLIFVLIYLCLGHIIMYSTWVAMASKERKIHRLLRLRSTMLIQSSLNALHLMSGIFFPLVVEPNIPIRAFGLTMFSLGVFLAVWARITMGKTWDVPANYDSKISTKLITKGPFAFSRNPIYLGVVLISFGMAIALKSAFFIFSFFLYFHLFVKIRDEEKLMQAHFQDKYTKYRLEIPRFL